MPSEAEIEAGNTMRQPTAEEVKFYAWRGAGYWGPRDQVNMDMVMMAREVERLRAALSAVRSEGVKVRGLKWGAIGAARQIFSADTAMGEYTVEYYEEPGEGAGWSAVYQDGHELGDYATEAEAKSAAQEHYTNAVLSAITLSQPEPKGDKPQKETL